MSGDQTRRFSTRSRLSSFDERVDQVDAKTRVPTKRPRRSATRAGAVPAPTSASGGQRAPRRRRPHAARSRPAAAQRSRRSRRRRRRSGRSSCWFSPRRRRAPAPRPRANSEPPMTNAVAETQLTRRRRRAVAGAASTWVTSPASETKSTVARLRAAREVQIAVPPCGRRQRTRVVNGPAPSPPGPPHSPGPSTELEGGAEISWSRARSRAAGSRPSRRGRRRPRGP